MNHIGMINNRRQSLQKTDQPKIKHVFTESHYAKQNEKQQIARENQEETSQKSVQVIVAKDRTKWPISDGYSAYQNKTCQPYAGKQGRQKQSQQGGLMFYFPLLYLI